MRSLFSVSQQNTKQSFADMLFVTKTHNTCMVEFHQR